MPRNPRLTVLRHAAPFRTTLAAGRGWALARVAAFGAMVGLGAMAGCSTGKLQPCDAIPEGGCPIGRGGTCDDTACRGLYECVEGRWSLLTHCAGNGGDGGQGVGGAGGAAGAAGSAGMAGAGGCSGVELDHTGETQGCSPELELPDCPALVAESCQPCVSGCADFFMCLEGAWGWVAYCTEQGQLVVVR